MALYLLALAAFAWRCYRAVKVYRLVLAVVLVAVVPLMATLPALASLGGLAVLLIVLNATESIKFKDARAEIRHAEHSDPS